MIPNWVILAGLGGIFSNLFNFISRYVLKDEDEATSWAWLYETIRVPLFLLLALFDFRLKTDPKSLILLFFLGLTEFISVYLYMKMHAFSHLSISTIISRTRLIWIPLIAFLFLGETLRPLEYLGILVLFIGVSVTVTPQKFLVDKGAIYANLAAIVIAINVVLLKLGADIASPSVLLFFYSLPSVILFPIFMKNAKERLIENSKKNFIPKLIGVLASMGAGYFLVVALKMGDVSKVNAIYQGMMVTSVLAGIIILKEREDILKKTIGTFLTIIGVILLT